ncbi:MAG: F0F1 ATP synthase subunit delta [Glaciecola sp.]|mgnify:FL=1|jgi:F-type H+-transporting ATPase subunit delta|nr:F0F1 ATP synthase subunit delta [Glaciecola sp.]
MSELTTVARPYAKAAFDFAVEKQTVAQWQEMLVFAGAVAQDASIKEILKGAYSASKLAEIFIGVCGEQIDENGQNLIRVLAENKRLSALPDVATLFSQYKAEFDKEIEVDVTSAIKLTKAQQTSISAALEKRLSRKVNLICNVDKAIVAGLIIKAGDTVIDGSIQTKLNRLADALQA